jgi:ATP-dependent Clp protease ATP-binding subunit ClpA
MNILLQILDEGKVMDSHGRIINFENTVVIMTSNAGSNDKNGIVGFGKNENEVTKEKAKKAITEFLRPEFISRVDEIVLFNKLRKDDFIKIAHLMLDEYVETLAEHGVKFMYDCESVDVLTEMSFNGKNGARDLRNNIRCEIEDTIANLVIKEGGFSMKNIIVGGSGGKLKIRLE